MQGYIIRDAKRKINWLVGAQLVYNKNEITHLSQAIKDQTEAYMNSDADDEEEGGIQKEGDEGRAQNSIYAVRSLGNEPSTCLLYTEEAADELPCEAADVLRRINTKNKTTT